VRKRIETVGSHLTEWFAIARIRVRDLWHLQQRVVRQVLAPTVSVFLNLLWGVPCSTSRKCCTLGILGVFDLDGIFKCVHGFESSVISLWFRLNLVHSNEE
jgi:hypothetical protein